MSKGKLIVISGPSGAGKSTLARAAAEALHILYVDTGAIYRTIGVYMYRHDIAPTDAPAVIAALPEITVALRYDEEGLQRMYLNGEDVTKEIRLPMISKYASDVSGKNQLVISVGCTGGKHRSVTVANALYETLEKLPYTVRLYHRDIGKDRIVKGE